MTPFVKDQLVKNIVASLFYTVNFDESMSRVLQNGYSDSLLGRQNLNGINSLLSLTAFFKTQCSQTFLIV